MIRTSFSTLGCPDWSWHDLLEYGPPYGYDGVEIRLIERETDLLARAEFQPDQLKIRRRELAEAGFCVCGLASSVRFDDPSEAERAKQVDIGKATIDLAAELGASFVRVFGDTLPAGADADERERAIENIAEGLQRLGEYAGETGPRVLIETHGDFAVSAVVEQTLTRVDSPAVGVLWDTHHPWRFHSEELSATFDRLRRWIRHTHWKDSAARPRHDDDEAAREAALEAHTLMSGHRHADYVLFGGGEFPALECMRLLRQTGYDGWFSLEWEKMWHPEIEDPEIALPLFPAKIRELSELADLLNDRHY
jgi:sugar phosphate isomerase/epimerase